MQSFVDFEGIDMAEEIATWDMPADFNEGNILDGLATPTLPWSPLFEPLAPDVSLGQRGQGEQGQSATTEIDQIVLADYNGTNNVAATSLMSPNGEVISAGNSATVFPAASSSLPSLTLEDSKGLGPDNLTQQQPSNAAVDVSNFQPLLPPILSETQMHSNYPSPVVGLDSQRSATVSSVQVQELPPMTDYLNLSFGARNELLNILQARGTQTENGLNNAPNIVANANNNTFSGANCQKTNNNFGGANYQTSSYPSLYQQNPQATAGAGLGGTNYQTSSYPALYQQNPQADAGAGLGGANYQASSYPSLYQQNPQADAGVGLGGRIPIPNQRNRLLPQQVQTNGPHRAWNSSRPQYNPSSTTNAYDSQIPPSYNMQSEPSTYRPQQFTGLMQQGSNYVPGLQTTMQRTYDAPYGMQQHAYPTHHDARQEPYSYVQSNLGSMPPNGYNHQLGYESNVPEPAYPSGPPMYQNNPSQPQLNPYVPTYNSMPQRQPLNYDNRRIHYRSQNSMLNGLSQLGSNQNSMPIGFGQLGSRSFQLSGALPLRATETRNEGSRQRGLSSAIQGTATLARLANSQVQEADEPSGSIVLSSMPSGFGQLGSRSFQLSGPLPLRATETRNEESRHRGQSSATQGTATLEMLTNSQVREADEPSSSIVPGSRGLENERAAQKVQEPTALPALNSRPSEPLTSRFQVAPTVQPQIPASSNRGLGDIAGIAQSASSSRPDAMDQLCHPENVQLISSSVPTGTDLPPNQPPYSEDQRQSIIQELEMQLKKRKVDIAPGDTREEQPRPRRGRPPKRAENGGSHSSSKRPKLQQETVNNPSQAAKASEYEGKEKENDNAIIPILARGGPTTVYDRIFEGKNLPVDPHLRMLQVEKK